MCKHISYSGNNSDVIRVTNISDCDEELEINLSHCNYVHHKPCLDFPGILSRPLHWQADDHFSHGTTLNWCVFLLKFQGHMLRERERERQRERVCVCVHVRMCWVTVSEWVSGCMIVTEIETVCVCEFNPKEVPVNTWLQPLCQEKWEILGSHIK